MVNQQFLRTEPKSFGLSFGRSGLNLVTSLFNLFDIVFKEGNVPSQEINQVLVSLYYLLLVCYGVALDDSTAI